MKQLIKYINLLTCALLLGFTSCEKVEDSADKNQNQTLIFYFAGTDLTFYFYRNISAIKEALRQDIKGDSRVMLFFQQGEKNSAEIIELTYKNGLCEEQKIAVHDLPEQMDANNLSFFLKEIMRHAPADKYSLIIGSHGLGWIPMGASPDGSAASLMRTSEKDTFWQQTGNMQTRFIGEVSNPQNAFETSTLAQAIAKTGVQFEYILFDACFMANVESAYDLRNSAKYIVGSVCEIMGAGFPYNTVLPHLLQNNGTSYNLDSVCQAFNTFYSEHYGYSGSISVINCAELEALAHAMKKVNQGATRSYDLNEIQFYEGQPRHVFFDLGDYVEKMCEDNANKSDFISQLDRTVATRYTLNKFYSAYGKSGTYIITSYSGLNTSAPALVYTSDYKQTAWYKATH